MCAQAKRTVNPVGRPQSPDHPLMNWLVTSGSGATPAYRTAATPKRQRLLDLTARLWLNSPHILDIRANCRTVTAVHPSRVEALVALVLNEKASQTDTDTIPYQIDTDPEFDSLSDAEKSNRTHESGYAFPYMTTKEAHDQLMVRRVRTLIHSTGKARSGTGKARAMKPWYEF